MAKKKNNKEEKNDVGSMKKKKVSAEFVEKQLEEEYASSDASMEKKDLSVSKDDEDNHTKQKYSPFVKRLGAYLIDVLLIAFIASIITSPFTNTENYQKLSKESEKIIEDYSKGKIAIDTYMSRASDVGYDIARETGMASIVTLTIYVLYFIVFQCYQDGQTLGKRIMKIKIQTTSGDSLSMNQMMIRSCIVNSILADLILLLIVMFGGKDMYFLGVGSVETIQYALLFVTVIMILSRKDKKGLHDMICHTEVINVEEEK